MKLVRTVSAMIAFWLVLHMSPMVLGSAAAVQPVSNNIIVIFGEPAEEEKNTQLAQALSAHFSDLNVTAVVEVNPQLNMITQPSSHPTELPIELFKNKFQERLLAVIYLSQQKPTVMRIIVVQNPPTHFVESLPPNHEDWFQTCDAVSSKTRSLLLPWLESQEDLVTIKSVAPPASTSSPKSNMPLSLGVNYGFSTLNFAGDVSHGPQFNLAFSPFRYFELGVAFSILVNKHIEGPESTLSFQKLPLVFFLGALVPLGHFSMGVHLGLSLDFTDVTETGSDVQVDETQLMRPGFTTALLTRYAFNTHLRCFLSVGFDFYKEPYRYRWSNEIVFVHESVLLRGLIGLELVFPLRN